MNGLSGLRFEGRWRHYQELALTAFEADRAAGRDRTHIVAPPGSGKTLLGVELVRRLGRPALVLAPNQAIQAQWPRAAARFGAGPELVATAPSAALSVLTYQSLCRLDDPGAGLRAVAKRRWAVERAAATGMEVEAAVAEAEAWTGEAAKRRDAQVARVLAALKREVARGEHPELELADLLAGGARERVDALRALGVATIVLDECHHLASLWGYVVRAVLAELGGGVHVVGLTATPPGELTEEEAELYDALLGPVDFTVPTPAVVRDGFLAPYQELAWLTEPLDGEREWLKEHDVRFAELVTALHDESAEPPLPFPEWVIRRLRWRGGEEGEAEVPWERFARERPRLARAGVRFLASAGLALPPGAPRGEGYREPPDLDDWLVLLEDYALRCLAADPSPQAADRYAAIAAALRDLGFTLTRRGLRRGASDVDRVLTRSAAKALGLVEVLGCESDARGDALRALVLCDAERASAAADPSLQGVLDAGAGTAAQAVLALAGDVRTAPLRPLLVTGRGVRAAPGDAEVLAGELSARAGEERDGLVLLDGAGVTEATLAFERGATGALVSTRALLGEGWDCPCVNVLVDLTAAATGVSVRQMRGRSLRLDPGDPGKIASNWDVVCVAPDLARGAADYRRFVRKHLHVHAPAEDGVIEAGPSHVHPSLSPFAPPPAGELGEINRAMTARSAAHEQARELWAIGTPYEGVDQPTVVVRAREGHAAAPVRPREAPPRYPISQAGPATLAGAGAVGAVGLGVLAAPVAIVAAPVALVGGAVWAAARLRAAARELGPTPPLDLVARAVVGAYLALGELGADVASSLTIEPRASGYLRARLTRGTAEDGARLATGLAQILEPAGAPRYLVSRLVRVPGRGAPSMLGRALLRRPPYDTLWHAVPDDLGSHKDRAEAFHIAWRAQLGPSALRFTQRSDEGRRALADAAAQAAPYDVAVRDVWR